MKSENTKKDISLPLWNEMPDIGLYMDQVLVLMEKYIGNFLITEEKDSFLTPSMINNYVKLGVMPAPISKKYFKEHLTYLIIICLMKQALAISSIKEIIEKELNNTDIVSLYDKFCEYYTSVLNAIMNNDSLDLNFQDSLDNILKLGIISNICRIISDKELLKHCKNADVVKITVSKKEKAEKKDKKKHN